ncbi:hypothetical protein JW898_00455 [Candidatus Woesearchaeota archaeon]|nr:hypothetical protein [Candidatus Woesearchaeota archaeon]
MKNLESEASQPGIQVPAVCRGEDIRLKYVNNAIRNAMERHRRASTYRPIEATSIVDGEKFTILMPEIYLSDEELQDQ